MSQTCSPWKLLPQPKGYKSLIHKINALSLHSSTHWLLHSLYNKWLLKICHLFWGRKGSLKNCLLSLIINQAATRSDAESFWTTSGFTTSQPATYCWPLWASGVHWVYRTATTAVELSSATTVFCQTCLLVDFKLWPTPLPLVQWLNWRAVTLRYNHRLWEYLPSDIPAISFKRAHL